MQKSVNQKQQSLFTALPVPNKIGEAGLRSSTPNSYSQVPSARANVNMSAATIHKPTFGGQPSVQVPPLQVDDLLDFKFPLKTSIREAHIEKWTNPKTGQLYNWQQPQNPAPTTAQGYKPVDMDQLLDMKYTQGYGLQTPAVQSLSAEQAKQMIKGDMNTKQGLFQKVANVAKGQRTTPVKMNSGSQAAFAMQDMYPPNYQQVTSAPTIRNLSAGDHAHGIIENYIDEYETFKN